MTAPHLCIVPGIMCARPAKTIDSRHVCNALWPMSMLRHAMNTCSSIAYKIHNLISIKPKGLWLHRYANDSRYSRRMNILAAEMINGNCAFGIGIKHKFDVVRWFILTAVNFVVSFGRFHEPHRLLANVDQCF